MKSFTVAAVLAVSASAKMCTPYVQGPGDWNPASAAKGVEVKWYHYGSETLSNMPSEGGAYSGRSNQIAYPSINLNGGLQAMAGRTEKVMGVWTGHVQLTAGTWTFGTWSDDGSLLWIDDQLVVSNDGLHGATEKKGTFNAPTDGLYKMVAKYYNNTGDI